MKDLSPAADSGDLLRHILSAVVRADLLEAMNYAKPASGCQAGGIPEMVDHGITGLLVEFHAPVALAEAIVSLLKSPVKLREMGVAADSGYWRNSPTSR